MGRIEYNKRINEKIQEIADGRLHQYEEVENVIYYIIWLTEQQIKNELIERIERAKLLSSD